MSRGIILTAVFISLLVVIIAGFSIKTGIKPSTSRSSSQKKAVTFPLSQKTMLGQNIILGFEGTILYEKTKQIIKYIEPAGIVLYKRNYQSRAQFKKLIADLQQVAKSHNNYSYFIMIDEEPGGATRLGLFKNVFVDGVPKWDQIESDIKEMANIGINVDLAPLADFPFNKDTFIKKRIHARTTDALIDFNQKFIALLKKHNISATLKHFPGMGVFAVDPHDKLPHAYIEKEIIDKSIQIFKKGIDNGAEFIMTGHAVYDDIDPGIPATLSYKITTDILRNDLAFSGLTVTDDLSTMPFVIGRGRNKRKATVKSLKAGHNLIMFSHLIERTLVVFNKLLQQMQSDEELRSVVERNYKKVMHFKQNNFSISQN